MGIKLSSIMVDITREREGDWIDVPAWEGVALKVRSTESPAFKEARDALMRRFQNGARGKVDYDDLTGRLGTLYARYLLLGWRGVCDDDGKPIEYTPEYAEKLLSDPACRVLTEAVLSCALQVGRAEVQFIEDAAKN